MPSDKTTKNCPYCFETIQAKAVFCRYCRNNLRRPIPSAEDFNTSSSRSKQHSTSWFKRIIQIIILLIAVALGAIVAFFVMGGSLKDSKISRILPENVTSIPETVQSLMGSSKPTNLAEFKEQATSAIEASLDATYGMVDKTANEQGCRRFIDNGNAYCMKTDSIEYTEDDAKEGKFYRAYVSVRGTGIETAKTADLPGLLGLMVFEWNEANQQVEMSSGVKNIKIRVNDGYTEPVQLLHFGKLQYGWIVHVPVSDTQKALVIYAPDRKNSVTEIAQLPEIIQSEETFRKVSVSTTENSDDDFYPLSVHYLIKNKDGLETKESLTIPYNLARNSYSISDETGLSIRNILAIPVTVSSISDAFIKEHSQEKEAFFCRFEKEGTDKESFSKTQLFFPQEQFKKFTFNLDGEDVTLENQMKPEDKLWGKFEYKGNTITITEHKEIVPACKFSQEWSLLMEITAGKHVQNFNIHGICNG
ncbi:MAG: hypothetical protein KIG68_07350, partial [Oxalobacter sp.]|nr:hypothetical protein [Oxalobacter sp.]